MKHTKWYLIFAITALVLGITGTSRLFPKKDTANITKASETGFIIDDNKILTKYKGTDTKIIIPDGVTGIGDSAFSGCSSLISITIPGSVKTIGNWAFLGCSSLTKITIPDNVETIGDMAFGDCKKLTAVTIPDKTTKLGSNIFNNCPALKEITVKPGNKKYITKDGVLFKKVKTNLKLMVYPAQKKGNTYTLPGKTGSIECGAFSECKKLKELVIPGNITNINYEQGALWGSANIKTLKINMKKGGKTNLLINLNLWNDDDGVMPEIIAKNKKIASIKLPEKDNYFKDDGTDQALVKGVINAKKKGKATIIIQKMVSRKKQTSSKEFELENVKLKTTLEITVK